MSLLLVSQAQIMIPLLAPSFSTNSKHELKKNKVDSVLEIYLVLPMYEHCFIPLLVRAASLITQMAKNLYAVQETPV